ncbi:MAG: TonB-dependent receptor, partial [Chryseolinea sp.]
MISYLSKHISISGIILLALMVFSNPTTAQQTANDVKVVGDSTLFKSGRIVNLTGTVRSKEDKLPISGASLYIDGTRIGNNSDAKGLYQISLPNGRHKITVRYLGTIPIQQRIAVYANGVLDFTLEEKIQSLEEVIVKARKEDYNVREALGGVTTLSTAELKKLPSLLGETDIIKSIQLLPGVTSVGEGTAAFNVRGGRVDQNLVSLDGAQIFNAAHLLGFFSGFNSDVTESFTLYKGSIPAQYGGRLSSVLDVTTRNGNFQKVQVKGGVGPTSARVVVDGPIVKDKTSFLIGTRFSYSDWILGLVKNVDVNRSSAHFYDFNAAFTHRVNKNNIVSLSAYTSKDFLRYSQEFGYRYGTSLGTLKWNSVLSSKFTSHFTASYGDYTSNYFKPSGQDATNTRNE